MLEAPQRHRRDLMPTSALSSLSDKVAPLSLDAHVLACVWLGRVPAFALGDGTAVLAEIGENRRVVLHPNAGMLAAASDGRRLVTGGDDGRVMALETSGAAALLGETAGGWIDAVATGASGAT